MEDYHFLVASIISKLFTANSMSSMHRVRTITPLVDILTYTQWSSETTDKPNEVIASWKLKYQNLKNYLRPYMDLLR